ncbi:MAG: hybrid sensor histidine kinase/response regulator, partial [Sphaerotilus sp.]|nr:hybrid sensor histidine kinase/response regulator [Sphaerotilus sp.]
MTDDLSALAWVLEELRKTLEAAQKSLRRYLCEVGIAEGSDLDDVEPAILRTARQQIHQGVGALELVNLPEGALLLRSAEQLVQRFVAKPQRLDAAGVEAVEKASLALLDYLGQKLAGKPVQAVGLFAQWRVLLELNSAERIHPADLWIHDWRLREVPDASGGLPHRADAAMLASVERALLGLMRQNTPAAANRQSVVSSALAVGCGILSGLVGRAAAPGHVRQ